MASDVKYLEHPTLKVPYEILNKRFRLAQKNIDREVQRVQAATSELEKCLQRSATIAEVTQVLDGMTEKLMMMKRKAEESIHEEIESAKTCKRRLDHLTETENTVPAMANAWRKKRLDRMLVEYFLRTGYYNTAIQLAKHSGIEDLTNIDLFMISHEVEKALANKDTSKCLAWCYDNKSKLRKMKSTLEFSLRQQEFIELVRNNNRLEAVTHARKHFVNLEDGQYLDVQRCMGLLAFPLDTEVAPYKELLDTGRWQQLILQFRRENFKLYQLSQDSIFTVTLQAGLSALKTPQCYMECGAEKNPACPVCSKHLNVLARKLPFAHCAQSRLICAMSGQPLNEHNPPMMLPNGYVYGLNAMTAMANVNGGMVTCPRTKDTFDFEKAQKVFVM